MEAFELYTSAADILESDIFADVRDTDADVKAALAVVKSNLAAVCLLVHSYGEIIQAGLLLPVLANLQTCLVPYLHLLLTPLLGAPCLI